MDWSTRACAAEDGCCASRPQHIRISGNVASISAFVSEYIHLRDGTTFSILGVRFKTRYQYAYILQYKQQAVVRTNAGGMICSECRRVAGVYIARVRLVLRIAHLEGSQQNIRVNEQDGPTSGRGRYSLCSWLRP